MNDKKPTRWERTVKFMGSKGFYIVLFLCVAVIGVAAWVMSYTMRQTGLDLSESLNETLGIRVTANIPSPSVPIIAAVSPNPSTVLPPTTAAPDTSVPDVPEDTEDSSSAEEETSSYDSNNEAYEASNYYYEEDEALEIETVSAPTSFLMPVTGNIETMHSVETLVYSKTLADWRAHNGVDIEAPLGTKVQAVAYGVVEAVKQDQLMGTVVVIDHGGGLRSIYSNLASEPPVAVGNWVEQGDIIGSVGKTSLLEAGDVNHLHFEMTLDNKQVDPLEYLIN